MSRYISKTSFLPILVIFLALFLRFFFLSSVPPSASLDEASIGYNAYSLIKTGTDEYGYAFPLLLRAYDDWRPAAYVYLVTPFIYMFGLNVLAVRLPSAILSVLTVLAVYFLVKTICNNYISDPQIKKNWGKIALLTSLLLAISPWHIYISRLGHEANLGLAALVFAVLFFLKKQYFLSGFFFSLSLIAYQSEKLFVPLLLLVLAVSFKNDVVKSWRTIVPAALFFLILLIPFFQATLSPNALIRLKGTNAFTANEDRYRENARLRVEAIQSHSFWISLLHSDKVVSVEIITENYLSHFNPFWLFFNTSSDKHKVPNLGLLYLWEAPFIIIGLLFLLKNSFDRRMKFLIISWILFSPLSAAITTEAPHAMRSYTFLPTWQILGAFGIYSFSISMSRNVRNIFFYPFLAFIFFGSIAFFSFNYFITFPKSQSASFQYALSEAIPVVIKHEKEYDRIVFSNQYNLYQSYMFFLFYSRYDPYQYKQQGGTKSGGFAETHHFGKYEFRPIDLKKENLEENVLYVVNISEAMDGQQGFKTFRQLNGDKAIYIIKK